MRQRLALEPAGHRERHHAAVRAELHPVADALHVRVLRRWRRLALAPFLCGHDRVRHLGQPVTQVLLGERELAHAGAHAHPDGGEVGERAQGRVGAEPARLVRHVTDLVQAVLGPAEVGGALAADPRVRADLLERLGAAGARGRAQVDRLRVVRGARGHGRGDGLHLLAGELLRLVVDDDVEAVTERRRLGPRGERQHAAALELERLLRRLVVHVRHTAVVRLVLGGRIGGAAPEHVAEAGEHLARGRVVVIGPEHLVAEDAREEASPGDAGHRLSRLARDARARALVDERAALGERRGELGPVRDDGPLPGQQVDARALGEDLHLLGEIARPEVRHALARLSRLYGREGLPRACRGRRRHRLRPPCSRSCRLPRASRGTRR